MNNYIAIIHKNRKSVFGLSFPDFPGCITVGSTLDEAKAMAQEALEGHIQVAREYGDAVPDPMNLEDAMAHPFADGALVFFVVSVPDSAPKAIRLNISMPSDLVSEVDHFAKSQRLTRSAFLAKAARQAMRKSAQRF